MSYSEFLQVPGEFPGGCWNSRDEFPGGSRNRPEHPHAACELLCVHGRHDLIRLPVCMPVARPATAITTSCQEPRTREIAGEGRRSRMDMCVRADFDFHPDGQFGIWPVDSCIS